jgi:hypothetical protein
MIPPQSPLRQEYASESEEIATYAAIDTLAETLGDKETQGLARAIRREEERMRAFLERDPAPHQICGESRDSGRPTQNFLLEAQPDLSKKPSRIETRCRPDICIELQSLVLRPFLDPGD